ncbi:uncharacterized protein LOC135479674 [Liolophura sinensis]|uniref:uncharacterized protein LOC135479674 n=1 Tax=Liolophura sinensis TaxID=3198878 RepID=UPI003158091B
MADVKVQVDSKLKEFEQLFKNKDFNGLENRYAENCVFLPAGQNKHQGRNGISDVFKTILEQKKWESIDIRSDDVDASGDLVVATGNFIIRGADGSQAADGKYVFVWKRVADKLLLKYDIFNLNSA